MPQLPSQPSRPSSGNAMKPRLILAAIWLVCLLGAVLSLLSMAWHTLVDPARAWLIAVAIDDTGNVAFDGSLGQTISSRCAHSTSRMSRAICWMLEQVDPGHCARARTDPEQNLELKEG